MALALLVCAVSATARTDRARAVLQARAHSDAERVVVEADVVGEASTNQETTSESAEVMKKVDVVADAVASTGTVGSTRSANSWNSLCLARDHIKTLHELRKAYVLVVISTTEPMSSMCPSTQCDICVLM